MTMSPASSAISLARNVLSSNGNAKKNGESTEEPFTRDASQHERVVGDRGRACHADTGHVRAGLKDRHASPPRPCVEAVTRHQTAFADGTFQEQQG